MAGLAQQVADLQQELQDMQQGNQQLLAEAQWTALPADIIQRRIEVMADPGSWDGNKAQFAEWWAKMRVWVMQNVNTLLTPQDKATAVWSQMKGLMAGTWPTWHELKGDIESYFAPQSELCSSHFKDFFVKFNTLHLQLNTPDAYAAILLEQASNPLSAALALEHHHLIFGTTAPSLSCPSCPFQFGFSNIGTQPSAGAPMVIGATTSSHPVPAHIKCYSCGGNHFKHDCPKQPSSLPFPDQDPALVQVQGMSFEEMKAFFYDQQINEMRVQGNEFGQ
ncbi:hypothetical protein EDD16DRAFT_1697556 [Pisolithus croceorrhizus]|nr:hypothetical protein EDD16DRAFT_1697556 [Pisolithus croceorrhizus]KAI6148226.1 hypothetical protein EDD17DRAFT_1780807 [Pisolithus thermaeus]